MDFKKLLDKNGKPSSMRLSKLSSKELGVLTQVTSWLPEDAPIAERLYLAIHDLKDYPKRCVCNQPITFSAWGRAYQGEFCSLKCAWANKPKKEKVKKTLLNKEERLKRQVDSNLKRYGVEWPWMSDVVKAKKAEKAASTLAKQWIEELANDIDVDPLFSAEDYIDSRQWLNLRCKKCSTIFQIQRYRWQNESKQKCPICYVPTASAQQHQIADWLKSLGFTVRLNDRKVFANKFEIDIWIESHNVGIEFDGAYWHSERGRPDIKQVSLKKAEAFKEKGIKLISIFDFEWENNQDIVKSRIKNILSVSDNKIFARKCEVVKISAKQRKEFLNLNHLQGDIPSTSCIGLMYNFELVAVMSFGKSRFNKKIKWELLRFATIANTNVVGAASRLFSQWRKDNSGSIISFSDNRWGTGEFYKSLGFKNDGQTGQGYFYIGPKNSIHTRYSMMKSKLKNKLKVFDENLTERDNCWNNNYYRVWDLGNTRWVINE